MTTTLTPAQAALLIELPTVKHPTCPVLVKVLRARRGVPAGDVKRALTALQQERLVKKGARVQSRGATVRSYHLTQPGLTARAHALLAERRAS